MPNVANELSNLSSEFGDLVKLGIGEKRKALEIQKLISNVGKYVHFSDSDRAGISFNKDIHPGNPRGFYGYPLTEDKIKAIASGNRDSFDEYGHRKYIYVFDATGNILNLDKFDLNTEFSKLMSYVKNSSLKYKDSILWMRSSDDLKGTRPSSKLIELMHQIVKMAGGNFDSGMNSLYRKLGYDAVLTNRGGFGDDIREQIVVLVPTSINIIHKLENPLGLTKDEEEEDRKFMADLQAKREEREKLRNKEDEEIKARMAEYERKEAERLAERAKYEATKNTGPAKVASLQALLKSGEVSVNDVETLKDLAEIAFMDYAKVDFRAVKYAGSLLSEKGILSADDTRGVIGFLKASAKL